MWGERDSNPQSSKGADLQSARLPITGYLPMLNNLTTSSDSNRHTIIHASYGYGRHPRILTRVSYYTCVYQFHQTPKDCYLLKRCAITPNALPGLLCVYRRYDLISFVFIYNSSLICSTASDTLRVTVILSLIYP